MVLYGNRDGSFANHNGISMVTIRACGSQLRN